MPANTEFLEGGDSGAGNGCVPGCPSGCAERCGQDGRQAGVTASGQRTYRGAIGRHVPVKQAAETLDRALTLVRRHCRPDPTTH